MLMAIYNNKAYRPNAHLLDTLIFLCNFKNINLQFLVGPDSEFQSNNCL